MKLARSFLLLGALLAPVVVTVSAQSTVTTEREVGAPATTTETKTYIKDGKTITERVTTTTQAERDAVSKTYKVAVFVSNRAGKTCDDKVGSLEDYVTGQITDLGVSVISRETASNAVASLDPNAKTNVTDKALADGSSAVRLAQTLGADYLLQITLTGFDANARTIDAYGVQAVNVTNTLRVTYKILDGASGASLAADTVKVSKLVQQSPTSASAQADVLDELLSDASKKVAASLKTRVDAGRIDKLSTPAMLAKVTIEIDAADLMIPDVRVNQANVVVTTGQFFKSTPLSATVEVDGIAVGTAPGVVKIRPGLSRLRISRTGFEPWERTINALDGMKLIANLKLSESGQAQWRQSTKFLNDLKDGAKLTDAEVKVLEGEATRLSASGYRVDVKVNTKENFKFIVPGTTTEVR